MAEGTSGDSQPLNIHQRLFAVRGELGFLEKDKEVTINNKKAYGYISHDAVTAAVRVPLQKHGVFVVPSVVDCKNDGNRTEMRVRVEFVNVDNPRDAVSVETFGYGVDQSDKGPGKAYSYALKYAYLKMFLLNSGEDIEESDIKHDSATTKTSEIERAKKEANEALQVAAKNFKAAIDGATTVKELNELQRENKDWLMGIPDVTRDYFIEIIETRKAAIGKGA